MDDKTSSSRAYDYDVVLSYGGEGTERRFAEHLHEALVRSGLRVFKDDDLLSRETISISQVQKAREQSRISIVVFNKGFVSSDCLVEELMTIVERSRNLGLLVVPVFYYVDPSKIRDQTGNMADQTGNMADQTVNLAAAFARYEQELKEKILRVETVTFFMDMLKEWREVVREVSDLMGFVFPSKTDIDKSIIIQHFVDFIKDGLQKNELTLWRGKECHLMNNGLSKLPENMNFPVLRKLFLQDNYDLSKIPLSFFDFMPALQVLDMSRTNIKYLPPSISRLVELQQLLLRGCKLLMELPPEIQALTNLEVLDLAGTELIYIPKEIEMLQKLERLEVSLCACADEYISEIKENGEIIPRKTFQNSYI